MLENPIKDRVGFSKRNSRPVLIFLAHFINLLFARVPDAVLPAVHISLEISIVPWSDNTADAWDKGFNTA
jgi:hypothetical protein